MAQVVGIPYVSAYDPVKNAAGEVIGAPQHGSRAAAYGDDRGHQRVARGDLDRRARGRDRPSGSRDIAEGIGVVSGAVEGTRASVSVSHQAADELNSTAQRLTTLVNRFTV